MIQLSLNVLLVMDCVTARCGSQVQPTKMTLARQQVLSSSEVRASDLEHAGSWVRIPSLAQIFSVSSYGWFFRSPFISFINISGIGWFNISLVLYVIRLKRREKITFHASWKSLSCQYSCVSANFPFIHSFVLVCLIFSFT